MATVKPHQIKLIHTLKSKAGIDQDLYLEMLAKYKAESSKDLSWTQANFLIEELAKAAGQKVYNGPRRLHGGREMATVQQKNMIEAMWSDVSRKTTAAEKKTALNHFLERFGISHLEWLSRGKVEKVVKALIAMGAKSPEEYKQKMQEIANADVNCGN